MTDSTTCAIVGGGPAGMVLGLLLARAGVEVTVLEKHAEEAIIDRHESNGMLFNAFFEKPGFREALLKYLGTAYEEIREAAGA